MAVKKNNIAELTKQCEEAKVIFETLAAQLEEAKKEEEKREKLKLEKEKASRKKEVDEAFTKYKTLLIEYINDYGIYSYSSDEGDVDLFSSKFWNSIC